ncbi:hypothetical protein FQR65_LT14065 [Abscondita terminalis]|nr:hypothetical protein FQR65_LT14065 [Abscondita terminalis]
MSDSKWGGGDVINFLNLYRKYPCLWDVTSTDYLKRDIKQQAYQDLKDLEEAGLPLQEDALKKKIKVIRDSYRNEVNKIKKSKKSGAGTEDIYKPKLQWFCAADSFLNSVISGRTSSSNLALFLKIPIRLQGIAELACTGLKDTTPGEDQYDAFSKHIASQLRELPMRSFLMLQQKFQELITQERLAQLNQVQLVLSPANSNSNDDSNTLSNNYVYVSHEEPLNTSGLDVLQQALITIGNAQVENQE